MADRPRRGPLSRPGGLAGARLLQAGQRVDVAGIFSAAKVRTGSRRSRNRRRGGVGEAEAGAEAKRMAAPRGLNSRALDPTLQ